MLRESTSTPSNDASLTAQNKVSNKLTTQTNILTAENLWTSQKKKLFKHMSRPYLTVLARSTVTVTVGLREERKRKKTNMLMVQDPGFTLNSTVTCAIRFGAHVVLIRMNCFAMCDRRM